MWNPHCGFRFYSGSICSNTNRIMRSHGVVLVLLSPSDPAKKVPQSGSRTN